MGLQRLCAELQRLLVMSCIGYWVFKPIIVFSLNHAEQKSFESNLQKRNVMNFNKEPKRKFVKSLSLSRCDTKEEQVETET